MQSFRISVRTTVQFTPQQWIDSEKASGVEYKTTFKTQINGWFLSLSHNVYCNTVTGLTSYIKIFTRTTSRQNRKQPPNAARKLSWLSTPSFFEFRTIRLMHFLFVCQQSDYKQQHTDHGGPTFAKDQNLHSVSRAAQVHITAVHLTASTILQVLQYA